MHSEQSGAAVPGLPCPRALGSPLKGAKLESNQIRGFRREEGLEKGRARGAGPLRKLLQYPEVVVPGSGEAWGRFEGYSGEE